MYAREKIILPLASISPDFDIEYAAPTGSVEMPQMYRLKDYNDLSVDLVGKVRWEISLV